MINNMHENKKLMDLPNYERYIRPTFGWNNDGGSH